MLHWFANGCRLQHNPPFVPSPLHSRVSSVVLKSRLKICCGHHTSNSRRSSRSTPAAIIKLKGGYWIAIRWMARCWQIDFQILSYCRSYLCYSQNDCNCWRHRWPFEHRCQGVNVWGAMQCYCYVVRQPASSHSWLVDKVTCHIHWTDI